MWNVMGTINYGSNKILINVGYHYDFDYSEEEIRLVSIKFLSEMGNWF